MGLRVGLGSLLLLVLTMFFDVLLVPGARVLGSETADMARQFLPWREFGFAELAKGNLALWNPHNYAGAPFFGGMQSALLYPPNALFLVLPAPLAAIRRREIELLVGFRRGVLLQEPGAP